MYTPLSDFIIMEDSSLTEAMNLMNKNAKGIVFVVDKHTRICGVLSDGDIRRAILKKINLEEKLAIVMNRSFVAFHEETPFDEILENIKEGHKHIPLVNSEGKIVNYYSVNLDVKGSIPIAQPNLLGNELKYVTECIYSNWISSQGKFVTRFEEEFTKFVGSKYALATSSGTTALHLALEVLGIGYKDEVIVPTLTFIATANAVSYTGGKAVFADSEKETWNIDPKSIEGHITTQTKAIIPVHLYGHPAKMDEIMGIAKKNKLFVIEDAAEAHGADYKGKKAGTIGEMGIFSFFGNKIITTGEGGMIVTDNKKYYEKAKMLRDHGMSKTKKYWHSQIGFNYRLTNIQAAIGCAQMERVEEILLDKARIKEKYDYYLEGVDQIKAQPSQWWAKSANWMYSVTINSFDEMRRNNLLELLKSKNVDCRPLFYPIHTMPPYLIEESLPVAEKLSAAGISLPSYPGIQDKEIKDVSEALKDAVQ